METIHTTETGIGSAAPGKEVKNSSLRVDLNLLDSLMALAGELVLSRNQLVQSVSGKNFKAFETATQQIDRITTELQETIMSTRMQSIDTVFDTLPSLVKELSGSSSKSIDLSIEGNHVELDKTILESLGGPLATLVKFAVSFGIETKKIRKQSGKSETGQLSVCAFHEASQVNIELSHDGIGIDIEELTRLAVLQNLITKQQAEAMGVKDQAALLFTPGLVLTAGDDTFALDAVKLGLDKLGGTIEIDTNPRAGMLFNIKLPLTLAIIPSQIVSVGEEKYAIPQANLKELLRIPAGEVKNRIQTVGDAPVVRLRGDLLPLLDSAAVLNVQKTFIHPNDRKTHPDQRKNIADRRSKDLLKSDTVMKADMGSDRDKRKNTDDRRCRAASALNIAVVSAGEFRFGLVVSEFHDSEEIVVKPLGRHLMACRGFAGATLMGDGKVALILDVLELAQVADLKAFDDLVETRSDELEDSQDEKNTGDDTAILIFQNAETERFAVPLNLVDRIEMVDTGAIEEAAGKHVIQYRGRNLPLYGIEQVAKVGQRPKNDQTAVIVFKMDNREFGLLATPPVDSVETEVNLDQKTFKQPGIDGSTIINGHTTLMVNVPDLIRTVEPAWFDESTAA